MQRKYIVSLSAFAAVVAVLLSISALDASIPTSRRTTLGRTYAAGASVDQCSMRLSLPGLACKDFSRQADA